MNRAADSRRKVFDGTAPWSLEQLSSGLHSYLTSPVDRWFSLGVVGTPYDQLDFEAKAWLEQSSDAIYSHFSNPFASFNPCLHELYLDLGAFGTGVIYEWLEPETQDLMFRSYPLADCWVEEDSAGHVNRLHRKIKWTCEQLCQEFGSLPEKLRKMKPEDTVTVIHAVYPRDQYDPQMRTATNKAYASVYVCQDTSETLSESGYDHMPYHVPRWSKLAGEVYGRSPALSVFPEIRMVNAMSKTLIVAAQKIVDPPLAIPDDGFMLPIKQTPGGLNFFRAGTEEIKPIVSGGRIDIGVDMIEQRREVIRRGFYVDWLVRPTKKERQTAQEIMDDRNQMLSMMAPIVGRLQAELLGPIVRLSYNLLARRGLLPPMPGSLDGAQLDLVYISPAAKAQSTVRGQGVQNYVQQLTQLLPVMPNLLDSIDEDGLNAELQDITDVPRRVLLDPKAAAKKRQAREQQQNLAQAVQAGPAAAKTAKDFASAQADGMQLGL